MASFLSNLFGSKPKVPPLPALSLANEQSQAVKNNQAIAPAAGSLARFTADQITGMMRSVIPNFDQITSGVSANIASEVKGEIPKDVQDAVRNSGAAHSLEGGYGGSEMGRDLVARDLMGLTSLALTDKGLSSAETWMASSERLLAPATAELTSMFVTPSQQAAFDIEERNAQYEQKWLSNQISAMPDPTTTGLFRTGMAVVGGVAGGIAGGPMGGAMGAQMGSGMANSILGQPQQIPQYNFQSQAPNMSPNSAGDNFSWNSGINDMFDDGFDFGGGNLIGVMAGGLA